MTGKNVQLAGKSVIVISSGDAHLEAAVAKNFPFGENCS